MNRFSHVDLAAPLSPPACEGGGKGGDVDARHSRRALRPPLSPPAGGQGGAGGGTRRSWTSVAKTLAFSQRWVC